MEISETGTNWVKVIDGSLNPMEVRVRYGETIKISSSIAIPVGQYEGIRLVIEPKVRITRVVLEGESSNSAGYPTDVTINSLPAYMGMGKGIVQMIPVTDTILFTSANGYLVPFNIENNKETFIVLDLNVANWRGPDINNVAAWDLYMAVRATRFLY